jgi:hypothetical protein
MEDIADHPKKRTEVKKKVLLMTRIEHKDSYWRETLKHGARQNSQKNASEREAQVLDGLEEYYRGKCSL